jgi:hypothetical protein
MEDGGAGLIGFFGVEGEVEGPVVEVVGVDEGLVKPKKNRLRQFLKILEIFRSPAGTLVDFQIL